MRGCVDYRTLVARLLAAVVLIGSLCSCKAELYEHLDERDANEMLSMLYTAGLHAEKNTSDDKTWSIRVEEGELPAALRVVTEHGLPRERFASVGEVFKKEGLVSTPSEERIRYIYAVSQELSNTLSQIDGVIVARVHPVIPANDPLAVQLRPASASVFIKYRKDVDVQALAPRIKNLVMRSIEGLQYENIALTFVPAEGQALVVSGASRAAAGARTRAVVGGFGMLVLLVSAGLSYAWRRYLAMRTAATAGIAVTDSTSKWPWAFRVR